MNVKKYMVLIIGGTLCLILSVGAIFFLFKNKGAATEIGSDVARYDMQLMRLQKRNPFPSFENVETVNKNNETVNSFFGTLLADLSKGQKDVNPMEPAQFGAFLETTTRSLRKAAAAENVKLPDGFAFGFDLFERGALPESDQIPRLIQQVFVVEELIMNLFSCDIQELTSVERDRFDQKEEEIEAPVRRNTRRRGNQRAKKDVVPEKPKDSYESELFFREPIRISFKTREGGLWTILDLFASTQLFTIIEKAELSNKEVTEKAASEVSALIDTVLNPEVQVNPLSGELAQSTAKPEPPSRDKRIIAGRESVSVVLDLSVFRFKPLPSKSGEQGGQK